jgi:hypothetical protein
MRRHEFGVNFLLNVQVLRVTVGNVAEFAFIFQDVARLLGFGVIGDTGGASAYTFFRARQRVHRDGIV